MNLEKRTVEQRIGSPPVETAILKGHGAFWTIHRNSEEPNVHRAGSGVYHSRMMHIGLWLRSLCDFVRPLRYRVLGQATWTRWQSSSEFQTWLPIS